MKKVSEVGMYCQRFRIEVLNLTLKDVSESTGVKIGTLSAFENGSSTNITHVFRYVLLCSYEQKEIFTEGLSRIFKGL